MLKTLIFIMIFVLVLCEDKISQKDSKDDGNAKQSNETSASPQKSQNSYDENEVSEGLKAVTEGAKQIFTGVLEVGSGIISAITRWFDGSQKH